MPSHLQLITLHLVKSLGDIFLLKRKFCIKTIRWPLTYKKTKQDGESIEKKVLLNLRIFQ